MSGTETNPGNEPAKRSIPILVLLPVIIFSALAGLFLFQLTMGGDPSKIPSVLIDKPAPDFDLDPLEGVARDGAPIPGFASADFDGKVTVVNIFASWCGPCRQEHPLIEALGEREDIQLAGINYKDKPENARRFLGSLGNPYDLIGTDVSGRVAIDWGVYGVPETFIVDGNGKIRYKYIGPLGPESYRETFLPELERVLGGA